MKRMLAVVAVLALAAAGCGGEDEEGEGDAEAACDPAPAAMSAQPELPTGFPTPDGVTYTGQEDKGPSTVVSGYREGELQEAFDAYKSEIDSAGFDVTKDEKEADDAEVAFSGKGSTGQVKLIQECQDRTSVAITVRPE